MSPADVDALDIAVCAALLGVRPEDPDDPFGALSGDFGADSAAIIARRVAAAAAAEQRTGSA